MRLKVLGTGNAFSEYNTSFVLEAESDRFWIDLPVNIVRAFRENGLGWDDVDNVIITHLHRDHVGDLERVLQKKFWKEGKKINLYALKPVFDGLSTAIGPSVLTSMNKDGEPVRLPMNNFVNYRELDPEMPLTENGVTIESWRSLHDIDCSGLRISHRGRSFVYGGDGNYTPEYVEEQIAKGRLSKMDAERLNLKRYAGDNMLVFEGNDSPYYIHTDAKEYERLPPETRDKLYLAHFPDDLKTDLRRLERGKTYEI